MRPPMPLPMPMPTAALQQNEVVYQQTHVHTHNNCSSGGATQQQTLLHSSELDLELNTRQRKLSSHTQHHNTKLPPLELLVEHKLSYSSAYQHSNHQEEEEPQIPAKRNSLSSPSTSSEDCLSAARASIFDDAAENFIINFPADSSQQLLPLSETVPLLTHVEATVVDKQRSIRLNKNSASLIFTKKELGQLPHQRRQHHSSLYGKTKHLPPTRGQHQRRSLQLNYNNNNLVTTASSAAGTAGPYTNNNNNNGGKLVPQKQLHHGLGLISPTATSGAGGGVGGGAGSARKQLSYSWYAPVYSALEEELEQESRDSSPIHNLANTKQHQRSASQKAASATAHSASHAAPPTHEETVALLDTQTQSRSKIIISAANGDAGGASSPGAGGASAAAAAAAGHDLESSLGLSGGQLPRRRRFENFLKSLVGLKASNNSNRDAPPPSQRPASPEIRITRTPSEQDVVFRDPAGRQQLAPGSLSISGSSSSLNVVQQKLWHIMRRDNSASSLHQEKSQSIVQYTGLRKCETVLALTRQSQSLSPAAAQGGSGIFSPSGVEQIRPLNRLRNSVNSINGAGTCSRCSSLLSLAASGSRYSLANGFVARPESQQSFHQQRPSVTLSSTIDTLDGAAAAAGEELAPEPPHINVNAQIRLSNGSSSNVTTATLHSSSNNNLTLEVPKPAVSGELGPFGTNHAYPLTVSSLQSMATANQAAQACCVRDGITLKRREMLASADVTPSSGGTPTTTTNFQLFTCKLCLTDVEIAGEATTLVQCGCQFCTECMRAYVDFEISEGAYEISCPDAKCPAQGAISLPEIANLTTTNLLNKHHRYRLNREIELDKTRTWCPRAGCETICMVGGQTSAICQMDESPSTSQSYTPTQLEGAVAVNCPSCKDEFCALCKKAFHPNISCEEFGRRLIADGQDDIGIPFDNELIKCCPMCAVPIEKDEGCAQMMCKRCKHVFCWYCLASLDDDFLLRHYDKGPCKNKLGHSRASVVWHRAQVIGIFAGFGILLLVASPLLLLAAPCIICCKCRGCSGSKIDEVDAELEEEVTALQG